jgi:excisionase family DNA binding protein
MFVVSSKKQFTMSNENINFENLPQSVAILTKEVSELKRLLIEAHENKSHEHEDKLLSVDEVADLLRLTKSTVYSKNSKGELPGVCKRGKRLFFQRDVLINWIKDSRRKSNAEIEQEAGSYVGKKKGGYNG